MGVSIVVETAYMKNWNYLWIESDSKLACLAFKSPYIVPWKLKNIWKNCLLKLSSIEFHNHTHLIKLLFVLYVLFLFLCFL